MRVLHVSGAKGWRGGEQQIAYLLHELNDLNIDQHIALVRNEPLHTYIADHGLANCIEYSKSGALNLGLAMQLKRASRDCDVVHAHDSHAHTAAYMAALLGMKTPIVVSRRVDFPIAQSWGSRNKYNHASIAKILCVSEAIRKIVARSIERPERAVTVHSGVNLSRFPFSSPTGKLRKMLGISADIPIIGNTSALADHKDHPTFIRTAQRVLESFPEAKFVVFGEGALRQDLQKIIDEARLSNSVHLLGFQTNIHELIPDFNIFLMTSKTEGLGTSILDAFACNVPVIATNAGGISEMVFHNQSGLLAEVGDDAKLSGHVIELLRSPHLADDLRMGASSVLKGFTTRATALKTLAQYQSVI